MISNHDSQFPKEHQIQQTIENSQVPKLHYNVNPIHNKSIIKWNQNVIDQTPKQPTKTPSTSSFPKSSIHFTPKGNSNRDNST